MAESLPPGMHKTILWTAGSLGGTGLFSAFAAHADLGIIAAAWATMFVALAHQAGQELDKDKALKVAGGLLLAIGGIMGGAKLANTYFAYSGVGTVPAMLLNASANAGVTYMVGKAAARMFLSKKREYTIEQMIAAIFAFIRGVPHPED